MSTRVPTSWVWTGRRTTPGEVGGLGLVWLVVFLAAVEVTLGSMASLWSSVAASEREAELRFRLKAYGRAIGRHRAVFKRGPRTLEELLSNQKRIKFIQRLYRDPMAPEPGAFEALNGSDGTIAGVASRAPGTARNGSVYREWRCDFRGRLQDGTASEEAEAPDVRAAPAEEGRP